MGGRELKGDNMLYIKGNEKIRTHGNNKIDDSNITMARSFTYTGKPEDKTVYFKPLGNGKYKIIERGNVNGNI